MIARVTLSDADKLRYGVAVDYLEFDLDRMSAVEAGMVQRMTRRPVMQVIRGLWEREPVLDDAGEPVLNAAGQPVTLGDIDAQVMAVWVGLRRIGHEHSWAQAAEFDILNANCEVVLTEAEQARADAMLAEEAELARRAAEQGLTVDELAELESGKGESPAET